MQIEQSTLNTPNPPTAPLKPISPLLQKRYSTLPKPPTPSLTKQLVCPLCRGLFRFPLTLFECGHSFCRLCIYEYIGRFKGKNPKVKCPNGNCTTVIEQPLENCMMRDALKQRLSDVLCERQAEKDRGIARRTMELFPECNLMMLFDGAKDGAKGNLKMLPELVKTKLNIPYEEFVEKMQANPEAAFIQYQKILEARPAPPVDNRVNLFLRPKTDFDKECVGLNNQIAGMPSIKKLRMFVERKLFEKAKETGKIHRNFLKNSSADCPKVNIKLWIAKREIKDEDDIMELKKEYGKDLLQFEYQVLY